MLRLKICRLLIIILLLFLSGCGGGGGGGSGGAIPDIPGASGVSENSGGEDFIFGLLPESSSPEYKEWLWSFPERIEEFPEKWNEEEGSKWKYFEWSADTYVFDDYKYSPCDFWFNRKEFNCFVGTLFLLEKYREKYHGVYFYIDQEGENDHVVFQGIDSEIGGEGGVFFVSFCGTRCKFCREYKEIYEFPY